MSRHFSDTSTLDRLSREVERLMDRYDPLEVLGGDLGNLVARRPGNTEVTPGAVVRLALLNDLLRIAEAAVLADGELTQEEIDYIEPLVREARKYLGRFRSVYDDTQELELTQFLRQHAEDRQKFGGKCPSTQWIGAAICVRASDLASDTHFVTDYRAVALRALDDLFERAGSGPADGKARLLGELARALPSERVSADPREAAYCSRNAPQVFHAVASRADVFESDPFDVEEIHAEARAAFRRVVSRAVDGQVGRLLLIKGDSGSGKTHLMRAFRNAVHGEQLGLVAYLQMSASSGNYTRYILSNVLDSWEQAFLGTVPDSALSCLSDSVARDLPLEEQEALRNEEAAEEELDVYVGRGADRLCRAGKYAAVDIDVLRMMLYLQRRDPARRARVLKFLRCEPLSAYDQRLVGGVQSFDPEDGPSRMLTAFGKLVRITGNGAMVLLVDQMEDRFEREAAAPRFAQAMEALRHFLDHVPSSVVVLACLGDYYEEVRRTLTRSMLDRLERDPEPVQLTAGRTLAEIERMLAVRLEHLFEKRNVRVREDDPLFPFRHEQLAARANQRTRDILDWARRHHEASVAAGAIVDATEAGGSPVSGETSELPDDWSAHLAAVEPPPEEDAARMGLLARSLQRAGRELEPQLEIEAFVDDTFVEVRARGGAPALVLALCDKAAKGGGLANQVEALAEHARARGGLPIVLRGSEYPRAGTSKVAQRLADLIKGGGRKLIVLDADWRALHAAATFEAARGGGSGARFAEWLRSERPITSTRVIRDLVALLEATLPRTEPPPAAPRVELVPAPSPPPPPEATLQRAREAPTPPVTATAFSIGATRGLVPQEVIVEPSAFVTHAAFLGSTKSGKTTLALRILEQLASRRVPILMIDRKGDLCRYAAPDFWDAPEADPEIASARAALRAAIDVRVYTPGEPRGRNLMLSVVPPGLDELPAHDRGIIARYAAAALGAMMGYKKSSRQDETRLGILGKAIELVGSLPYKQVGIEQLIAVLHEEDPELVSAIGMLDTRHFKALVENLATLKLRYAQVLDGEGDRLSPEALFGLESDGQAATRLTIVSTKFLGDNAAIDFWVARLLGDLSRWASRRPSDRLQAALFLDEADLYLPAQTKPATKEPMLDLLKRARSAGLGVFLATQSPGDLDYRCRDNIRTWFIGRVGEKTAVDKMKPLLSECRTNITSKLATAKTGEFFQVSDGQVTELRAHPSLLKTVQLSEDDVLRVARG